ncbi:Protein tyrosine phosphatase type IVA 3, partial [Kappamyces sp. JEL0680]
AYPDGDAPPAKVVTDWLDLVETRLAAQGSCCFGVHCVAGLGRAPALVSLALIEAGMAPLDSVIFIRERRRGVIAAG